MEELDAGVSIEAGDRASKSTAKIPIKSIDNLPLN
jgi:hypothetical protein